MKIIDYKIVYEVVPGDGSGSRFESDVRSLIRQGWQPLGPPGAYGEFDELYQAMVKYEQPKGWWEAEPGKGTNSFGPG